MAPVYKKGDKTDCSDYWGTSLLSATYKILSNILLSILTLQVEKNCCRSSEWISM